MKTKQKLVWVGMILALAMVFSMMLSVMSGCEPADDGHREGSSGLTYELSEDGTYYICTGIGTCTDTELVVGNWYNECPVTEIAMGAFRMALDATNVKSIELSEGITTLNLMWAGRNEVLETAILPDSLTVVGPASFYACTSLKSVRLGPNVTLIDFDAFANCTALTDIYFAGSKDAWTAIEIGSNNDVLSSVTVHYNYKG